MVQEVGTTQIVDAEPEVVQELTFPDVGPETDMRKSEDAAGRVDRIGCIIRTFQQAEQTQHRRR